MLISEDFLRAEMAYRIEKYAGERRKAPRKDRRSKRWTLGPLSIRRPKHA